MGKILLSESTLVAAHFVEDILSYLATPGVFCEVRHMQLSIAKGGTFFTSTSVIVKNVQFWIKDYYGHANMQFEIAKVRLLRDREPNHYWTRQSGRQIIVNFFGLGYVVLSTAHSADVPPAIEVHEHEIARLEAVRKALGIIK